MSTATLSKAPHRRPLPTFLRHLGEMTLAMFGGMFAFGLALGVVAGIAGSRLAVGGGRAGCDADPARRRP